MSLVKFIGVGHYCPENIVTNNQLSEIVDMNGSLKELEYLKEEFQVVKELLI